MIAIVAVSLCHIAPGVFLNKLAPGRPQASSQNEEQLSSQKTPKKPLLQAIKMLQVQESAVNQIYQKMSSKRFFLV